MIDVFGNRNPIRARRGCEMFLELTNLGHTRWTAASLVGWLKRYPQGAVVTRNIISCAVVRRDFSRETGDLIMEELNPGHWNARLTEPSLALADFYLNGNVPWEAEEQHFEFMLITPRHA